MITISQKLSKQKGSSLTFSAQGGRGKEKIFIAAKKISAPKRGRLGRGVQRGNAEPSERNKIEAAPAALLGQSRAQQKSFLFLLEEKNRGHKIKKCEENFFAGWRASASGGGTASIIGFVFPLKKGSREVYNYSTRTNFCGISCSARRPRGGRLASQSNFFVCFCRKIPEVASIKI